MKDEEIYLGDGAYAAFDGEDLRIWIPPPQSHEVYLGLDAWNKLKKFVENALQNAAEAAFERQQAKDLEDPPKTLQEQQIEAWKIKKGLR